MNAESIAITGTGAVTCLGLDRQSTWRAVTRGACGIRTMTALEWPPHESRDGGEAPAIPDDGAPAEDREIRYLRIALRAALCEADLGAGLPCRRERCGLILGTTLAGMRSGGRFARSGDLADLRGLLAGSRLASLRPQFPATGYSTTTCAACASGLASIGIAITMLESGELDLVVAGGYDPISEYAYAGFNSLRLVAAGPLTPFCESRAGMKLGEGYGVIVLEREKAARRRGASVLGLLSGYGESSDAHHLTQPQPDGAGASRAVEEAILRANLAADEIDFIAAHATGTPNNDAAEYRALRAAFNGNLPRIPVVAFKSHLGHTLGGAGAVELILALTALREQRLPPTANVCGERVEFPDLQVSDSLRARNLRHGLCLSLGFGGSNSAVVFSTPGVVRRTRPAPSSRSEEVCITGLGVIAPGMMGNEAFIEAWRSAEVAATLGAGAIDEDQLSSLIDARRVRRMCGYVKSLLAASTIATQDAGVGDRASFFADCAAVIGSMYGPTNYSQAYYRGLVENGLEAANPILFAEGVPNVGSAQLGIMLGLKGAAQTIIGTRTAGLDALQLAVTRIRSGLWRRAIVGAAEEFSELVDRAHHFFTNASGRHRHRRPTGAAAVVMILESPESAAARHAPTKGVVHGCCAREPEDGSLRSMVKTAEEVASAIGDVDGFLGCDGGGSLQRIERAGLRLARRKSRTTWNHDKDLLLAESFSARPLMLIASALLAVQRGSEAKQTGGGRGRGQERTHEQRAGVLQMDVSGSARSVSIGLSNRHVEQAPRPIVACSA